MSVQNKIQAGFAIGLAFLLLIGILTWRSARRHLETFSAVEHSYQVRDQFEAILVELLNIQVGERGFYITGNEKFLEHYQPRSATVQIALDKARQLTQDNPEQQRELAALEAMIKAKLGTIDEVIRLRRKGDTNAAYPLIASGQGKQRMDEIRTVIAGMELKEKRLLNQRAAEAQAAAGRTMAIIIFGSLLALGLVGVAGFRVRHDLIRRKKAEDAARELNVTLKERAAQLEVSNQELESFCYSVSHDLRAPLRHVQGYVQMLRRELPSGLSEKGQHYAQTLTRVSLEMGNLVDDLLAFSRMNRTEMTEASIPLDPLVKSVIHNLELVTEGRNIAWKVSPLPEVFGDHSMIKQVFANLLSNAVKYSRERDQAVIEIGVAGEEEGGTIFFVRDNGAGFDMQYAHKLFGVFQRLHAAEEFEGTGIGLANVRRIIARHGGRVWAEGKPNAGATFYFTLKLEKEQTK